MTMNKDELLREFTKPDGRIIISTSNKDRSLLPILIQETSFCPEHFSPRERLETLKLGSVPVCKTCNKPSKFLNNKWQMYCSRECIVNDVDYAKTRSEKIINGLMNRTDDEKQKTIQKRKQTCQRVYGGNAPILCKSIRAKVTKTLIERYGVAHALQNTDILSKVQNTMVDRYGAKTTLESDTLKESVKNTMIERYGSETPLHSLELKEKAKQTNLERYGFENPMQCAEVQNKARETCIERYGVSHIFQSEDFRKQSKQTNLDRYGFENPMQSEEIKEKMRSTCLERYGVENPGLLVNSNTPSKPEQLVIGLLDSLKVNYEYRNTTILDGKLELDFYLGDHNLAIEVNGLYWHSEKFKDKNYHLNKFLQCQSKGIRLLQFWDSEMSAMEIIIKGYLGSGSVIVESDIIYNDNRFPWDYSELGFTLVEQTEPRCWYTDYNSVYEEPGNGRYRIWDCGYTLYYREE